jgi:exosortase/archaeosortase family protein
MVYAISAPNLPTSVQIRPSPHSLGLRSFHANYFVQIVTLIYADVLVDCLSLRAPYRRFGSNVWIRFTAWIGAAVALSALTAPNFPSLVDQSVGNAFDGLFVAIPIVALLTLVFALRWKELAGMMAEERGGLSRLPIRLVGSATIVALFALEPTTGESLAASGIAVVLTFYAVAMVVNPSTARFMLPYAAVYGAAVGAPAVLLWAFGEPLAVLSSGLSAGLVGMAGFPVAWQGTGFQLISKAGEVVSGVVTPGCSSISSVTMFLGLLALMHLDMKKDSRTTAKLAAVGVLALILLNSVRILILLWVGYEYGSAALWAVHDWIGYALFLGFFLAVLPLYAQMGDPGHDAVVTVGSPAVSI